MILDIFALMLGDKQNILADTSPTEPKHHGLTLIDESIHHEQWPCIFSVVYPLLFLVDCDLIGGISLPSSCIGTDVQPMSVIQEYRRIQ
jgi:hypothetical protein